MPDYDYIELKGTLLQSKYGAYVITIHHATGGTYYYIGQSGDAKHLTARSSFYRLAAHLGYSKSTQNQVYQALTKETGITNRYDLENWMLDATIKVYFFKVADFQPMEATEANLEKHHG